MLSCIVLAIIACFAICEGSAGEMAVMPAARNTWQPSFTSKPVSAVRLRIMRIEPIGPHDQGHVVTTAFAKVPSGSASS